MTDLRTVIQGLLAVMRSGGQHGEAERFEIEFAEKDWKVDPQDQLRVLQWMMGATEQAPAPEPKTPVRPQNSDDRKSLAPTRSERPRAKAVLPQPPDRFAMMKHLSPWVGTIPGEWSFVTEVEKLMSATAFAPMVTSLERIFTEHLGFDPVSMDETSRLSSQTTLTKVFAVAKFEDFHVLAVEARYAGYHTSSFAPVFQLHPLSLIVALERGTRIRVVARRPSSHATAIVQRIMRGCGRFSFPDDDIFVWAYRFASLEPGASDDARAVNERARRSVSSMGADLCATWRSQSFSPSDLPGQPWENLCHAELREFLQPESVSRLFLGLEVELRTAFPWESRCGRAIVRYIGYRVLDIERDADVAETGRKTLTATIELDLEHKFQAAEGSVTSTGFTVRGAIAIPDARGTFVLYGTKMVFTPRLVHASLAKDGLWPPRDDDGAVDDDDELDVDVDDDDDDDRQDADAQGSDASPPLDDDDRNASALTTTDEYEGDGLVPLLRWVVGKKLRFLAVGFNKAAGEQLASPGHVLAWLGRHDRGDGKVQLTSVHVLRQYLEVFDPRQPLRTVVYTAGDSVPGWACLELARDLPPRRAYPIAGARVGPAGRLAAPVLDEHGDIRLVPGLEPQPNPRATSTSMPNDLWIAAPLQRFAGLPAGSVPRAIDLAVHGFHWDGEVFVCSDAPSEVRFESSHFYAPRRRVRWTFDLPNPPRQAKPTVRAQVNQVLRSGDPLADFPGPWTDARHNVHHVARVAEELASGRVGGSADSDSVAFVLRCPPSLAGRVDDIQVTPVSSARGLVTGYRITLVTSRSSRAFEAVLDDGHILPVVLHPPEEMPWNQETGEPAHVSLHGQGPEEAEGVRETGWQSGATGEPICGVSRRRHIVLLPRQNSVAPDPCLQFRSIDGWGNPRAVGDPHITQHHLELLAGAEPEQAAVIHTLIRTVHGGHVPSATSLFELARATHVAPPPFVPSDWLLYTREARGPYDPVRSAVRRTSSAPYASERGPWSWSCECGDLAGISYVQVRCETCQTETRRQWIGLPEHTIHLPVPVLHPWRKSITAGLLGITEDELDRVIRGDDGTPLLRLTEIALDQPTRSIDLRLAGQTDPDTQAALWQQRHDLTAVSSRITIDDLWLSELRILSPRLLFDGYRTGSTALLSSPLTRHYRKIQSLAKMDVLENPILRRALWIELQRTTDTLFGSSFSMHPQPGTLAELWHRVWPTTAPQHVRLSVPGLFENCNAQELRDSIASELLGSKAGLSGSQDTWARGILTTEGVVPLPTPLLILSGKHRQPEVEQLARSRCIDRYLRDLAAACLGIGREPAIIAALRGLPGAEAFVETQDLGRLVLRELLHRLGAPEAKPTAFLSFVASQKPLLLPRDHAEAHQFLEKRLSKCIPGDELGATLVRTGLTWIFGGFWSGARSSEMPHGWTWMPSGNALDGLQREVPVFGSEAWQCFPGYGVLRNPSRAAANGWADGWLPDYNLWFGLDAEELPPEDALSVIPEASKPATLLVPLELTMADEQDTRILEETLDHWLFQHRRPNHHVDS